MTEMEQKINRRYKEDCNRIAEALGHSGTEKIESQLKMVYAFGYIQGFYDSKEENDE